MSIQKCVLQSEKTGRSCWAGICLLFICAIFIAGNAYAGNSEIEIVKSTLAKGIDRSGKLQAPIDPSKEFSTTDAAVISHITYIHLSGSHDFRWKWVDPKGNIYLDSNDFTVTAPEGKLIQDGSVWHQIKIKDEKAMALPGNWKVETYLNDQLISSKGFSLQTPPGYGLPPELEISKISFSKNILIAGDTVSLDITLVNTGAGDAENVSLIITSDNLEISYENRKRFKMIPKNGGSVSALIQLTGKTNLHDGNAAIDIEAVEPHFGVEAEIKRVMISTMNKLPGF